MRTIILLLNLLIAVYTTQAYAKDGFYASANIGSSFASKGSDHLNGSKVSTVNLENRLNYGAGFGYNILDFSADITYTHFDTKVTSNSNDVKSDFVLLNGYYNFNNLHGVIKPYIGVGIGVAMSKTSTATLENSFAYQGIIGSKFKITETVSMFGDLRYTSASKAGYKNGYASGNVESSLYFYSANVGVLYNF